MVQRNGNNTQIRFFTISRHSIKFKLSVSDVQSSTVENKNEDQIRYRHRKVHYSLRYDEPITPPPPPPPSLEFGKYD